MDGDKVSTRPPSPSSTTSTSESASSKAIVNDTAVTSLPNKNVTNIMESKPNHKPKCQTTITLSNNQSTSTKIKLTKPTEKKPANGNAPTGVSRAGVTSKKVAGPTRVIQSRFLQVSNASKSGNTSNSRSDSHYNSSNNSSGNCTKIKIGNFDSVSASRNHLNLSGPTNKMNNSGSKYSPLSTRASNLCAKSTMCLYKSPSQNTKSSYTNSRLSLAPGKSSFASRYNRPTNLGRPSNHKLHSTVLNATSLNDKTQMYGSTMSVFSTTMVGGPGGKGNTVFDNTLASLPDLPDISAIRLDSISSNNNSGNDITVLSVGSEKDVTNENDEKGKDMKKLPEVTEDDLELQYIRYLSWACVDATTEAAFKAQVQEAEMQIIFLQQLEAERKREVYEMKQKLNLLVQLEATENAYNSYKGIMEKLIEVLPGCEEAEGSLKLHLENHLHQIKMENIYMPDDQNSYKEKLFNAIADTSILLQETKHLLYPRCKQLEGASSLQAGLLEAMNIIKQRETRVKQTADLAIQQASLQITAQQMKTSVK